MSSPTLIDDTNPVVQYAPGWIWDQLVNEVDHTRHGAATAGLTASLGFYGSGVQVVGTLEPSDHYGRPTTTYTIDGDLVGTYNAPFTASGDTHFNVTFFSKLDLGLDNHEIVITNVNGTSPNTFWLDYFLIYTQSPPSTTTTSTSTSVTHSTSPTSTLVTTVHSTSTTSTATSSSTSVVLTALVSPLSATSSSSSSTSSSSSSSPSSTSADSTTHPFSGTVTASPESNASTTSSGGSSATGVSPVSGTSQSSAHSNNTGKIVGGVVGGVAFLLLLALAFLCARRRRRVQNNVDPFTTQTRERSSFSGTLLGTGSPTAKVSKIPELSLASTSALTSPVSRAHSYAATASSLSASATSAQPPESALTRSAPASAAATPAAARSLSSPLRPSPTDTKVPESPYARTPASARRPLSLSPSSASYAGAGASDYAPSAAPADTEASRARWYAPAQEQSHAQSLLSLLSSRGRRQGQGRGQRRRAHDQHEDSGLRLYNEPALPPPYTAD